MTQGYMPPSDRIDWNTPNSVLKRVRKVAPIGLDPCSNPRSIVHASTEWSLENGDNAFAEQWSGRGLVYVNPEYGRAIKGWVTKMAEEREHGAQIIALLPARVGTKWWQDIIVPAASLICFWKGRLTFLGADAPAPFDSAVVCMSAHQEAFCQAFHDVGWIVRGGAE